MSLPDLPHSFKILFYLHKLEKIFLVSRYRSSNNNIYLVILKYLYGVASTAFIFFIPIDYYLKFVDKRPGLNVEFVYFFLQFIEHYLIVGVTYWYRDKQVKMRDKLMNVFKHLHSKDNNFKLWKYTSTILIWQLLTLALFVSGIIQDDFNWVVLSMHFWFTFANYSQYSNIIVCTLTYLNIAQAISRIHCCVKSTTLELRSIKINEDKIEAIEKDVCNKIRVMIKLYDEICDCTEDANSIFGLTSLTDLATVYTFNLLNILWATTLPNDYYNILFVILSSFIVPIMSASGESISHAVKTLQSDLARLLQTPCSGETRECIKCFIRTVKTQSPRQHMCGLINVRMSLFVGFLTMTASNTVVLLQFAHVV